MRRLVVPLFVVLLAFSVAGCGGGGEEAATEAPAATAAPPVVPGAVPVSAVKELPLSSESWEGFEPFPKGTFPKEVQKRLDEKRPMILLFVDGSQQETDDLRTEVDQVLKRYSGMIDLVVYDIGKFTSVNSMGVVAVDESTLTTDKAAAAVPALASALKVGSAPTVVVVDDQAHVIFRHNGLFESELLDRQVARTTD